MDGRTNETFSLYSSFGNFRASFKRAGTGFKRQRSRMLIYQNNSDIVISKGFL